MTAKRTESATETAIWPGAICVRCGDAPATTRVRAGNGSWDGVCERCSKAAPALLAALKQAREALSTIAGQECDTHGPDRFDRCSPTIAAIARDRIDEVLGPEPKR